ncbi:Protein kinase domain containing protein [Aphelenchoides avenae]|nr:Protein kinase domain containing protein [Aphelenchus avenae]
MSLSWANKLAKNAILTAQKAQNLVDSVLDIQEEENDDAVEEETSAVESTDQVDEQDDETPTTSQYQTDGNEGEKFTDVDLSVNTTHLGDWTVEPSSNDQVVVDSEPNPIRDAHDPDTSMCHHYSPSSHSPDEEEHNGAPTSAASAELDLSLINLDSSEMHSSMHDPKHDVSPEHRDDAVTIASSDIEVIKHVDNWSLASSSHRRTASDQVQGVVPGAKESTGAELLSRLDHIDQNVAEKIAVLEAQISQRDRRLEELNRANQNLKTSNSNLLAKNKQIAAKANNEAKLQKKIVEKDKELAELMEEGQRLSEHSGKQSKEIRRLKEQLKQLDVVTAARDSALEELKSSQDTIEHLTEEVSELKTQVKAVEQEKEKLREEYNLTQASTDLVQKHVAEREAEFNLAKAEIDRLSDELQSALRAKDV